MKKIVMTLFTGLVLNALPAYADVTLEMVPIPAGSFLMGCNDGRDSDCRDDEKPAHKVSISPFEMGKYEVTQGQWRIVMGENPSYFQNCGDACPVENVSWNDTQNFIQKLNAQTGKQYRLPSEAEWEYACRAGKDTNYCGGNDLNAVAWYQGNSGYKTHPVGGRQANAWGLYDMNGNVWEWVQDTDHSDYTNAPNNGRAWEDGGSHPRVLRGVAAYMTGHASYRSANNPAKQGGIFSYGFRLARTLP